MPGRGNEAAELEGLDRVLDRLEKHSQGPVELDLEELIEVVRSILNAVRDLRSDLNHYMRSSGGEE